MIVANYYRTPLLYSVHPLTEQKYIFTLTTTRQGGAIHIAMHRESQAHAGQTTVLRPSRKGYGRLIFAARALLKAAQPKPEDLHVTRDKARWVWNKLAREYPNVQMHTDNCIVYIDRLFNPIVGRPIANDVARAAQAANPQGMRPSLYKARTNRRAEILIALSKAQAALNPVQEKLEDARCMRGYPPEEVRELRHLMGAVLSPLEHMRRRVQADKAAEPQPAAPLAAIVPLPDFGELDNDDDEDIFADVPYGPNGPAL